MSVQLPLNVDCTHITQSSIILETLLLEEFEILDNIISYKCDMGCHKKIELSLTLKKIGGDSPDNAHYKIGNIVKEYRPTSPIKCVFSYSSDEPHNTTRINNIVLDENSNVIIDDPIRIDTNIRNVAIGTDGNVFINSGTTCYKHNSTLIFNISYII